MSVAGNEGGNHEINFAKRIAAGDIVRTQGLLRRIAAELPNLPEGSHELRIAHYNLHNIRVALARLTFRPR
jgi:hypothetical protein